MNTLMASAGRWTEQYGSLAERARLGVTMTLIGVVVVVLILALLSVLVSLISRLLSQKGDKEAPQAVQAARRPTAADADTSGTDAALIPVLAAAVAAYTASRSIPSTAGFIIRRIRRV